MRRITNNKGLVVLGILWLVFTVMAVGGSIAGRYFPDSQDLKSLQAGGLVLLSAFAFVSFLMHVDETDGEELK